MPHANNLLQLGGNPQKFDAFSLFVYQKQLLFGMLLLVVKNFFYLFYCFVPYFKEMIYLKAKKNMTYY